MKIWVFAVIYPDNIFPNIEYYDADKLLDKQREVLLTYNKDVRFNDSITTDINEVFREQLNMDDDDSWNDVLSEAYILDISGQLVEIEQEISIVLN